MTTTAEILARAHASRRRGDLLLAEQLYRQILVMEPSRADVLNCLGICLAQQGRLNEAANALQQALRLRPDYAAAHNNLGKVLQEQGRLDEALACFAQAMRCQPDYVVACFNRGVVHELRKELAAATAAYQEAVRRQPDYVEALNNLGNVLREQGCLDEARACLERALALRPALVPALANLGYLCRDEGRVLEADRYFLQAQSAQPDVKLRITQALLLPPVYQSLADLQAWRARITENIARLREERVMLDLTREAAPTPFYLPYQGLNDRDLMRDLAALFVSEPPVDLPRHTDKRIRVGFASAYFYDHTIGRLNLGLIANVARPEFHVTVLTLGRRDDEIAHAFRRHADAYVELPADVFMARRLIGEQRLDVLVYTDLGMDSFTYSLAFSRLAPVQVTTWGHPVTSGITTIDYFLSSKLLESNEALTHYTETLVRLDSLAVYYYRPTVPPACRADFGLAEDVTMYACPQSLFKLHPDFDAVLGEILRRDRRGVLVLLEGWASYWKELLLGRFAVTLADVLDRIIFLPRMSRDRFLGLCASADVLLDPLHFGGGNTSYEGLAAGTPVVTLPSNFLRGRITLALYRQMNFFETVVTDPQAYVELAVRLGTDREYNVSVREAIGRANPVLFENATGVRELEQWFRQVVRESNR